MPQTLHEIRALLAAAGLAPLHRLGQNFMIDGNLVRLVAAAGQIEPDDLVIEVGPGTGTLTELLLASARQVIAVEMDRGLASLLRQSHGGNAKLLLIEADALAGKHELNPDLARHIAAEVAAGRRPKLVANLPFNIASPLVIEMLIAGCGLLAFTVQREVAHRLRAAPGSDAYGPLSVMVQLLATVEVMRAIPRQAFWPMPKIDSALVRLTPLATDPPNRNADARPLGRFVHAVFASRRKTLKKALEIAGASAELADELNLDRKLRPENLSPRQFQELFEAYRKRSSLR
jgi:16S rRNA (adenine1518-N6/adenine1519-N6)-dimethyltransferase